MDKLRILLAASAILLALAPAAAKAEPISLVMAISPYQPCVGRLAVHHDAKEKRA
jgi:hypothetical protein